MSVPRQNFSTKKLFKIVADKALPLATKSSWRPMHLSDAMGVDIICDKSGEHPFGLGWIEFPPLGEVKLHTHEGSHILVCFGGEGVVRVKEAAADLKSQNLHSQLLGPGDCYSIESMVPHSVHASEEGLLLLVIGNDYREAHSVERLQIVNE